MNHLIDIWLTGFAVMSWTIWWSGEGGPIRLFESSIWPISMIVGTWRKLND